MNWPRDDQPVWLKTPQGRLMSVPYPLEINDSPAMLVRRHTADEFTRRSSASSRRCWSSRTSRRSSVAPLHTMIVGQPFRWPALRRALQHLQNHPLRDRVWWTRPGEVYDHCAALPAGTMPGSGE
jgi:allantoinase